MNGSTSNRGQTTHIKFLGRQLRELHTAPLPNVVAGPVDDDLTRWHGTITFPSDHPHYPALPLHFTMTFTTSYPSVGQELKLLNTIVHSHIYGDSICFSLLPDFRSFFVGESAPSTCCESPRTPAPTPSSG